MRTNKVNDYFRSNTYVGRPDVIVQQKMFHKGYKTQDEVKDDIEEMQDNNTKKTNKALYSDVNKYRTILSMYGGAGYCGGYAFSPQGGYVYAPQRGGYANAPQGGSILAGLAIAGLTAGVSALASEAGRDIIYPHVAPIIKKGINKMKDFFGRGDMLAINPEGQMPNKHYEISTSTKSDPIKYYRDLFLDIGNGIRMNTGNKAYAKKYINGMKKDLFGKKFITQMKSGGGAFHRDLKYRDIAPPLLANKFYQHMKMNGNDKAMSKERAHEIAYAISKRMSKRPIQMNEPHLSVLASELKNVTKGGKHDMDKKTIKIIKNAYKSLKKYSRLSHSQMKRGLNKISKRYEVKMPKLKGLSYTQINELIDTLNLPPHAKDSIKYMADIYAKKRKYSGGKHSIGAYKIRKYARKTLIRNGVDIKTARKIDKNLKGFNTLEDLAEDSKKPDSKLKKILKVTGYALFFILLLGIIGTIVKGNKTTLKLFSRKSGYRKAGVELSDVPSEEPEFSKADEPLGESYVTKIISNIFGREGLDLKGKFMQFITNVKEGIEPAITSATALPVSKAASKAFELSAALAELPSKAASSKTAETIIGPFVKGITFGHGKVKGGSLGSIIKYLPSKIKAMGSSKIVKMLKTAKWKKILVGLGLSIPAALALILIVRSQVKGNKPGELFDPEYFGRKLTEEENAAEYNRNKVENDERVNRLIAERSGEQPEFETYVPSKPKIAKRPTYLHHKKHNPFLEESSDIKITTHEAPKGSIVETKSAGAKRGRKLTRYY